MAKAKESQKVSNAQDLSRSQSLPKTNEGEQDFGRVEISAPDSFKGTKPVPKISTAANNPMPEAQDLEDNEGLDMRSGKFWMAACAIILILVAVFATASYLIGNKKNAAQAPNQAKTGQLSSTTPAAVVAGASPKALPPVKDQGDINLLQSYFKKVSANFRDDLMSQVPAVAVDSFKKYQSATGEAKVAAAQTFYIYLSSPASVANSDFKKVLADVKADLEKALGKPLF